MDNLIIEIIRQYIGNPEYLVLLDGEHVVTGHKTCFDGEDEVEYECLCYSIDGRRQCASISRIKEEDVQVFRKMNLK